MRKEHDKDDYKLYRKPRDLDEYLESLTKEPLLTGPRLSREQYREKEEEKVTKETVVQKTREKAVQEMIKTLSSDMKPLKEMGTEIVGDLFDRIEFIKRRIIEVKEAIEERKQLNKKMTKEIEEDIDEKDVLLSGHADFEEKREISMDKQLLRMERRKESVNYLRDIIELKRELMQLEEEFKAEAKIGKLFSGL